MRITLTEAEIKEAVSEKVLSQMSINENMDLQVDLSATRGADGFTATIDVVERRTEAPLEIQTKVTRARRTAAQIAADNAAAAAAKNEGSETAQEDTASTEAADTPADEPETPDEAPAPAVEEEEPTAEETPPPAPTGSIFSQLKKPTNTPSA